MTFGEKVRELRSKKGMSQTELGKVVGVSLRTVRGWEAEGRYPKQREIYSKLATALDCEIDYLLSEKEAFITEASSQFGSRGERDAKELVSELTGLFAGGEMAEEDMDALMYAVQEAYVEAKKKNREKFTPKKYRKNSSDQ
jgi:transcriptional regulator with XRE-family HTH domain